MIIDADIGGINRLRHLVSAVKLQEGNEEALQGWWFPCMNERSRGKEDNAFLTVMNFETAELLRRPLDLHSPSPPANLAQLGWNSPTRRLIRRMEPPC